MIFYLIICQIFYEVGYCILPEQGILQVNDYGYGSMYQEYGIDGPLQPWRDVKRLKYCFHVLKVLLSQSQNDVLYQ